MSRRLLPFGIVLTVCVIAACTDPINSEPATTTEGPSSSATTAPDASRTTPATTPATTADPSPSASEPVAPLPTAEGVEVDAGGHVLKGLGEAAEIIDADGTVVASVTVTSTQVMTECPGQFATTPQHGHFLVATVEASMGEVGFASDDLLLIGPALWQVQAPDGTVENELETEAAWSCYETDERLPNVIGPGESARGYLVLDTSITQGRVTFSLSGGEGWTWPIE